MRWFASVLLFLTCSFAACGDEQQTPPPLNQSGVKSQAPSVSIIQRERARIETLKRITPSVVCVLAADGNGGGSGVLISADGYAISNYHVTSGAGPFLKCGLSDGKLYDAVLVGIDPTGDVALIKLQGRDNFAFATPGISDAVRVGDEVVALGNPFLLASDFTPTVTYGIVSGVRRYQYPANSFLEYTDCIQIDASINPGNSGGPLFDIDGRWIGINGRASFEKRGRVNAGAAYAISVRQVLLFVEYLKSGLIVDHGVADFTVRTDADNRVSVDQVSELSEAWRRGLRSGHEVLTFAGRSLTSANDFKNVLGIFPEGTRVPVTWRDKGQVRSATIRLRPLHAFWTAPELPQERRPDGPDRPDGQKPVETDEDVSEKPAVPEALQSQFEERDGFTNYYFNRRSQQAVLDPLWKQLGAATDVRRTWVLTLTDASPAPPVNGECVIAEAGAGLSLGGRDWYQPADKPEITNEPPAFPGLLVAARQWHRLFQRQQPGFDDMTATGQTTHQPTEREVRVITTREGTRACRWYFVPDSVLPFGVDVDYSEGVDEARIIFDGWKTEGPVSHPSRIGVVDPATEQIRWLDVSSLNIREAGQKQASIRRIRSRDVTDMTQRSRSNADETQGEFLREEPRTVHDRAVLKADSETDVMRMADRLFLFPFVFIRAIRGQAFPFVPATFAVAMSFVPPTVMISAKNKVLSVVNRSAIQRWFAERTTTLISAPIPGHQHDVPDVRDVIDRRQRAIVKLFGAGVGNLDSYGSGIVVSPEGHVATIWNHLINVGFLTAVTHDGRKFPVMVVGTSREHDLALLKLESNTGEMFPFVDLAECAEAEAGDPVLAFSNMFHVAAGNEPVSVVHGVVAAKTPLAASQGRWSFPLKSPVLILDAVTNNSGAGGGLVTLHDGRPVGLIGREIRLQVSNTWSNYAVPLILLRPVIDGLRTGKRIDEAKPASESIPAISDRQLTSRFGLTLLPNVVERTPAYVDAVTTGGVADKAGLKRGDLIVLLDEDIITSVTDFQRQLAARRSGQPVTITVNRSQQLIPVNLRVP